MFIVHFFHSDSHLAAKPDFLGNLSKKVIESRYIGPKVRAVIDWMGSYPFNIPYNIMIWLLRSPEWWDTYCLQVFNFQVVADPLHIRLCGTGTNHSNMYMYVTSLTCQSELAGFYRDADVALVTPLRYDALSSFHPIASHKLPLPVINCHHMQ